MKISNRKSLKNRIEKLELIVNKLELAYPDPIFIDGMEFDDIIDHLYEDEQITFQDYLELDIENENSSDLFSEEFISNVKPLVDLARQRRDQNIKIQKEKNR